MCRSGTERGDIIVLGYDCSPAVFRVAMVSLNQRHRLTGDLKWFIGAPLPLELANKLALNEGQRLACR